MEEQLNWVLKLSLEDMALRRVLVNLWSKAEILVLVQKFRLKLFTDARKIRELQNADPYGTRSIKVKGAIENKVKDDVLKLVLPQSLKKRMLHLVRPIGSEILKWEFYHEKVFHSFCNFDVCILKQLCWTSFGVIDYRKTAEKLVRLEMLNATQRYILACEHCLVDYIPLLWEKLSQNTKKQFYNEISFSLWRNKELNVYWACVVLQGEEFKPNEDIFKFSAMKGNKIATEYFLPCFINAESKPSLIATVFIVIDFFQSELRVSTPLPSEKLSDIIFYLLTILSPEQQMEVLKRHPLEVLVRCLEWPWQNFFLHVADIIWTCPESIHNKMLCKMAKHLKYSGYYFPDLFQKFFLRSPRNFKELFVDHECTVCSFFPEFFHFEDADTIKVVFRQLHVRDRVRLVSSYNFYKLLDGLILRNKSHLVQLCFQEASLTKEDKERLKKTFMEFFTPSSRRRMRRRTHIMKQLFEILDQIESNTHGKRRCYTK